MGDWCNVLDGLGSLYSTQRPERTQSTIAEALTNVTLAGLKSALKHSRKRRRAAASSTQRTLSDTKRIVKSVEHHEELYATLGDGQRVISVVDRGRSINHVSTGDQVLQSKRKEEHPTQRRQTQPRLTAAQFGAFGIADAANEQTQVMQQCMIRRTKDDSKDDNNMQVDPVPMTAETKAMHQRIRSAITSVVTFGNQCINVDYSKLSFIELQNQFQRRRFQFLKLLLFCMKIDKPIFQAYQSFFHKDILPHSNVDGLKFSVESGKTSDMIDDEDIVQFKVSTILSMALMQTDPQLNLKSNSVQSLEQAFKLALEHVCQNRLVEQRNAKKIKLEVEILDKIPINTNDPEKPDWTDTLGGVEDNDDEIDDDDDDDDVDERDHTSRDLTEDDTLFTPLLSDVLVAKWTKLVNSKKLKKFGTCKDANDNDADNDDDDDEDKPDKLQVKDQDADQMEAIATVDKDFLNHKLVRPLIYMIEFISAKHKGILKPLVELLDTLVIHQDSFLKFEPAGCFTGEPKKIKQYIVDQVSGRALSEQIKPKINQDYILMIGCLDASDLLLKADKPRAQCRSLRRNADAILVNDARTAPLRGKQLSIVSTRHPQRFATADRWMHVVGVLCGTLEVLLDRNATILTRGVPKLYYKAQTRALGAALPDEVAKLHARTAARQAERQRRVRDGTHDHLLAVQSRRPPRDRPAEQQLYDNAHRADFELLNSANLVEMHYAAMEYEAEPPITHKQILKKRRRKRRRRRRRGKRRKKKKKKKPKNKQKNRRVKSPKIKHGIMSQWLYNYAADNYVSAFESHDELHRFHKPALGTTATTASRCIKRRRHQQYSYTARHHSNNPLSTSIAMSIIAHENNADPLSAENLYPNPANYIQFHTKINSAAKFPSSIPREASVTALTYLDPEVHNDHKAEANIICAENYSSQVSTQNFEDWIGKNVQLAKTAHPNSRIASPNNEYHEHSIFGVKNDNGVFVQRDRLALINMKTYITELFGGRLKPPQYLSMYALKMRCALIDEMLDNKSFAQAVDIVVKQHKAKYKQSPSISNSLDAFVNIRACNADELEAARTAANNVYGARNAHYKSKRGIDFDDAKVAANAALLAEAPVEVKQATKRTARTRSTRSAASSSSTPTTSMLIDTNTNPSF